MVIQPKVRGFLCTTTHPTGCFENVRRQAEHVRSKGDIADGPKRVLVLGASTGYGLASRIMKNTITKRILKICVIWVDLIRKCQ